MANSRRKLSLLYTKKCRTQKAKIKSSACADRRKGLTMKSASRKAFIMRKVQKNENGEKICDRDGRRKLPEKNKDSSENTSRVSMSNKNKRWKISIKRQTIALGRGAGKAGVRGCERVFRRYGRGYYFLGGKTL